MVYTHLTMYIVLDQYLNLTCIYMHLHTVLQFTSIKESYDTQCAEDESGINMVYILKYSVHHRLGYVFKVFTDNLVLQIKASWCPLPTRSIYIS